MPLLGYWGIVGGLITFVPIFLKDLVFRNASIGKKLLGIVIYDNNWQPPKVKILVKRTVLMLTAGYLLFFKIKFIDGDMTELFNWEKNYIGTRVIDKKIFKELSEQAKNQTGDFAKNLDTLYNAYLIDLYHK